jgi:ABC-type Na+ efflux pump permease subunit
MNWQNVAAIARKDLTIMLARRSLRISLAALPLGLAVLFSQIIARGHIPAGQLPQMLNAFLFFFMIYTGALPATLASYSLVGEKVERSLEPLLATPASDGEILLGKALASLVPPLVAMWAGMVTLMALCDAFTRSALGYLFFPNWMAALTVFGLAPLLGLMAVAFAVLWSARVSDVRTAQQLSALTAIPGAGLYIALVSGAFTLDLAALAVLCGVFAVVDTALALAARATFHREEILTRWA